MVMGRCWGKLAPKSIKSGTWQIIYGASYPLRTERTVTVRVLLGQLGITTQNELSQSTIKQFHHLHPCLYSQMVVFLPSLNFSTQCQISLAWHRPWIGSHPESVRPWLSRRQILRIQNQNQELHCRKLIRCSRNRPRSQLRFQHRQHQRHL